MAGDRPRKWAPLLDPGASVLLRNCAVLAPGEVLESDDPETVEVPWTKWISIDQATGKPWCELTYGLTVDGTDKVEDGKLRAAIQRLRTRAQTDQATADLLLVIRRAVKDV